MRVLSVVSIGDGLKEFGEKIGFLGDTGMFVWGCILVFTVLVLVGLAVRAAAGTRPAGASAIIVGLGMGLFNVVSEIWSQTILVVFIIVASMVAVSWIVKGTTGLRGGSDE